MPNANLTGGSSEATGTTNTGGVGGGDTGGGYRGSLVTNFAARGASLTSRAEAGGTGTESGQALVYASLALGAAALLLTLRR